MIKIGEKIKNLRLKNNLTQAELGNRCDLTKGFISQLEADNTSPSLSTLEDILHCLGTNFEQFFSNTSEEKIVYKEEDVQVKGFEDEGYKIHWLVSDAQKNEMEPIMLTLKAGSETECDLPHEGEEFGYVIQGGIAIVMNDKKYKVKKGESFYFQPKTPHYIKNISKSEAKVLWVSSPPSF